MNLKRELIESIDGRIFVGVLCFIAIMILVGWIAINEGARMKAFEDQYLARSIERGATMFNSNCSTCHGIDGRGVVGRAPGLNSPYLFGHDYLADVDRQIAALAAETADPATTDARKAEIDTEAAALVAERDAIFTSLQPAIDKGYNPEEPSRLQNLSWSGTLRAFVQTTIISGRPVSSAYWPQPMAAWSQTAGGPLRMDQIEDLTNYILNWNLGDAWTVEDANAVNQFPIVPVDPATVVVSTAPTVGASTDLATITENLATVTGDPQAGQALYNGALACAGCHLSPAVAPPMEGTYTRVVDVRLQQPENAGLTPQQYIANSIIHPSAYVSPGYPDGVMPQNFGDRLSYQDLADLIAFLETQDQPLPAQ
ncbi:MAG: c-type cytochrome [Anaerolineae bacterium]